MIEPSTIIGAFLFVIDLIQSGWEFGLGLEWRTNKVGGSKHFAVDEGLTAVINHCPLYRGMINENNFSIDRDVHVHSG